VVTRSANPKALGYHFEKNRVKLFFALDLLMLGIRKIIVFFSWQV
tara:strand:- start:138 stop:272 length:135 start_codon:yes stop_codon:yes gene_type:complete